MVSSTLGPKENWADSGSGYDVSGRLHHRLLSCPGRRRAYRGAHGPRSRRRGLGHRARAQGNLCAQAADEVANMDLLLTHGYFLHEDPKELQIMKPYAPLGLLYLSSYLRGKGFAVETYDSTFGSRDALFRILETERPATLGIYANLMTRGNALAILERAVACGWKAIVGGPEPASYADEYLAAGAHVVVSGEGELALEAILRTVPLEQVPGLYFRDRCGSTVHTGPARLLPDLDAQPWPDRERIDIGRYLRVWRERHGAGSVSVITARGCPYHCLLYT